MRIVIEIDEGERAVQVDNTAAESTPPVDAGSAAPPGASSQEAAAENATDVDAGPAGSEPGVDAPTVGTDDSPLDAGSAPDF
jgi:hypothetical protein